MHAYVCACIRVFVRELEVRISLNMHTRVLQSASSEPAFPVSAEVLTHLQEVGADLMKTEEELYLHGTYMYVYIM